MNDNKINHFFEVYKNQVWDKNALCAIIYIKSRIKYKTCKGNVLATCEEVRVSYTRGKAQLGLRWSANAERDLA